MGNIKSQILNKTWITPSYTVFYMLQGTLNFLIEKVWMATKLSSWLLTCWVIIITNQTEKWVIRKSILELRSTWQSALNWTSGDHCKWLRCIFIGRKVCIQTPLKTVEAFLYFTSISFPCFERNQWNREKKNSHCYNHSSTFTGELFQGKDTLDRHTDRFLAHF